MHARRNPFNSPLFIAPQEQAHEAHVRRDRLRAAAAARDFSKPDRKQRMPLWKQLSGGEDRIEIRRISRRHRGLLLAFYRDFEPLGAAQGLPPYTEGQRRIWIDRLLAKGLNLGAFARARLVGHIVLLPCGGGRGELAYFVERKRRRRGIGGRLLHDVLEQARRMGYEQVWASVAASNGASAKMLARCGFRAVRQRFPDVEMALQLTQTDPVATRAEPTAQS